MIVLTMERIEANSLESLELKFLLKLVGMNGHCDSIAALKPNSRTSLAKCDRICQSLADKGLVTYNSKIFRFAISAPGRMLLSLQTTSLPVTPDELTLLRACRGSMTVEKLGGCVPEEGRLHLIQSLVERKLLKVTKRAILEIRLTDKGKAAVCEPANQRTGQRHSPTNNLELL